MPRATITLIVPQEVWIGALSREFPGTRFRILAALPDGETGVGLVEVTSTELEAVVAAIEAAEAVTDLQVMQRQDGTALVQFETTSPMLLFPVQTSGVPLELPFDLQDGEAVWELTASRERLGRLGEQLDAFGIEFTVDRLQSYVEPEQLLTEQQEQLVREAVEAGYYDTPRDCTLTELADRLGMAKSTCSETLHRAEGAIIKQFVAEGLDERLR